MTGLPGVNTTMLPLALAERFAQHGVESLPGVDAYRALMRADVPALAIAAPNAPRPLLDCTPDELVHLIHTAAVVGTYETRETIGNAARQVLTDVAGEVIALFRAHADDIILQMRPQFDAAAAQARKVTGYGIAPEATAEDLLGRPAEQVAAWKQFRDHDALILESVLDTRRVMSEVLGIAPTPSPLPAYPGLERSDPVRADVNYAVAILKPWGGQRLETWPEDNGRHAKWLRAAPYLHLCTADEIDPLDALRAAGVSTVALEGVAQTRYNAAQLTRTRNP